MTCNFFCKTSPCSCIAAFIDNYKYFHFYSFLLYCNFNKQVILAIITNTLIKTSIIISATIIINNIIISIIIEDLQIIIYFINNINSRIITFPEQPMRLAVEEEVTVMVEISFNNNLVIKISEVWEILNLHLAVYQALEVL